MGNVACEISWNLYGQPWSDPEWVGDIGMVQGKASPEIQPNDSGNTSIDRYPLYIWEMPERKVKYTVAVDPSMGRESGDPAAIQVVDPFGRQIAEVLLRDRSLQEQCVVATWLGNFYNVATIVIEMNGIGGVLFTEAEKRMEYKNLYHERLSIPGFTTTCKTRDAMIRKMQDSLKNGRPILRSRRMREQFQPYRGDGSAEDDLLMSMLIAHYCV